jgi:hypothetical protein
MSLTKQEKKIIEQARKNWPIGSTGYNLLKIIDKLQARLDQIPDWEGGDLETWPDR